jgi:hypothetical protein
MSTRSIQQATLGKSYITTCTDQKGNGIGFPNILWMHIFKLHLSGRNSVFRLYSGMVSSKLPRVHFKHFPDKMTNIPQYVIFYRDRFIRILFLLF